MEASDNKEFDKRILSMGLAFGIAANPNIWGIPRAS